MSGNAKYNVVDETCISFSFLPRVYTLGREQHRRVLNNIEQIFLKFSFRLPSSRSDKFASLSDK